MYYKLYSGKEYKIIKNSFMLSSTFYPIFENHVNLLILGIRFLNWLIYSINTSILLFVDIIPNKIKININ